MQKLQLCSGREDTDLSDRITFDYFYGQEADMLSFYRIPKLLFTNCKCQYKNVGFLENKSVGFPTSLFSIFLVIFRHILHLIL